MLQVLNMNLVDHLRQGEDVGNYKPYVNIHLKSELSVIPFLQSRD